VPYILILILVLVLVLAAMAYLKVKDWQKAESDATSALNLDPTHTKSHQRRSVARSSLGKIRASLQDLHCAKALAQKSGNNGTGTGTDASINSTSQMEVQKIDADLVKVESMLLEATKRAPKRKIQIKVIGKEHSHSQEMDASFRNATATATATATGGENPHVHVLKSSEVTPVPRSPSSDNPNQNPKAFMKHVQNVRSWPEFEQIWHSLSDNDKPQCLEKVRPRTLTSIYKNGMEDSDLLLDLVSTCIKIAPAQGENILRALGSIPSIDMVVMMLKASEKEILGEHIKEISRPLGAIAAGKILNQFGLSA